MLDGLCHPPEGVVLGPPHPPGRVGHVSHSSRRVVAGARDQHRVRPGRHCRRPAPRDPAVGPHVHRGGQPVAEVVVARGERHPRPDARGRRAELARPGRVVEPLPGGHQGGIPVRVVPVLGLGEDGVAGHGHRVRPGRVTPAVGDECLRHPAEPVVAGLPHQPTRGRGLHFEATLVEPGRGGQCGH